MFTDELLSLPSSWEYILKSKKPVVIYGTGNGADKVIDEMQKQGIKIFGVAASDGFVRKRVFRGFEVKPLGSFEKNCIFAVAFGSCRKEVMNKICAMDAETDVVVPVVPVCGNEVINREFLAKNREKIEECLSLFDEKSKFIYKKSISFMFTGRLNYLVEATSEKEEIMSGLMKPGDAELFLDIGAYRGETVKEFLHYSNGEYVGITAAEPDSKTFEKLKINLGYLNNITLLNKSAYSFDGDVCFSHFAGRQSAVGGKGKSECFAVDTLFEKTAFSYIKIDAEGSESEIIKGMVNCLKEAKPRLNIALYHRSEDFFTLPLMVKQINPGYRFAVRRHPYIPCWDFNLYCF
ncbi:MAG: FkbM family methyltransferase [Clostridiales bacterium]|nr:FkbM family methyltransferase [Clostridiales bacterium]